MEAPYIRALLKEWWLYCTIFPSRPKIKELHLGGGTPTFFSPDNLKMLLEGIFKFADRAPDHEFSFEGHPNNTTYEHLKTLYDSGFRRVSFGVQDYNDKVQIAINRVQPFENVKKVTELARQLGYTSIGHDLIYGLPFQTVDDIKYTISKTQELMPDRLAFYSYAHVPWLKGNGQRGYLDADLPSVEEKRHQYEKGKELLREIGYQDIGMDHFALPTDYLYIAMRNGTLHRNFMGYTTATTHLMVGLGISSIGDSWEGFAQNVKGIEEYYHLLENDIIPVYRGHILSDEDRVIRKHILNLMCNFSTTWYQQEEYFPELVEVLGKLEMMEADGLVEVYPNQLNVTPKGRPFIRNICMAFDLLLHRKAPETRLFSMTV
tara:strand:- start:124905 stop:126032 length:1128 start_codon:yes stop_codon:yes gene_type:complete